MFYAVFAIFQPYNGGGIDTYVPFEFAIFVYLYIHISDIQRPVPGLGADFGVGFSPVLPAILPQSDNDVPGANLQEKLLHRLALPNRQLRQRQTGHVFDH